MSLRPAIGPIPKSTPKVREPKPLRSKPHTIPTRIKADTFDALGYLCRWCEVPGGALDLHHRHRRSQGGRDDLAGNLVPVHRLCHAYIHEHIAEAKRRRFIVSDAADLALGWLAADEVAT